MNVHSEDDLRRWTKEALIARVLKLQELVTLAIGAEIAMSVLNQELQDFDDSEPDMDLPEDNDTPATQRN